MTDRGHDTDIPPPLEAALQYAQEGLRVVPTHPETDAKLEAWQNVASADPETVRRLWEEMHPKANPALLCGPDSDRLVLDIDTKHGGDELLQELEKEENLGPLPETLTARTGSGGWHLHFNWTNLNKAATKPWGEDAGIDVQAGLPQDNGTQNTGALAWLPPTDRRAVKDNHYQHYAWEDPDVPVADLPETWVKAIRKGVQEEHSERFRLPEAIPEGARNDTLFRYGCQLRAQGADRETIHARLVEANQERCEPPLQPQELVGRVNSAAKHFRGRAIGRIQKVKTSPPSYRLSFSGQWVEIPDTPTLLDPNRVQALAADQVGLIPCPDIRWHTWKEKVSDRLAEAEEIVPEGVDPEPPRIHTLPELGEEPEPVEKLTPHLAYRDLVNTLYGGGKESGKSTLISTDIFLALRAGLRVLWMSEMPRAVSKNYLRRIRAPEGLLHPEEVGVISFRENPPRSWQEAEDLILEFGAQVIYVDTLVAAVRAFQGEVPDHADNAAWHSIYTRWFGRWATIGEGQAMVVAHHTRKADNEMIGSVGIRDGTDFLTLMEPATRDKNVRRLTTRGRMPPEEDQERYLRFDPETNLYAPADFTGEQGLNAPPEDRLETTILTFVRDNPGCRARALYEGVDHREKDVKEARDELLSMGLIQNESDSRGHAYHLGMDYEEALEFLDQEHEEIVRPQEAGAIF